MNCGAATAFLPKSAGFPSPRGLHSSTVQLRRTPVALAHVSYAPPRRGNGRAPSAQHPALAPVRSPCRGSLHRTLTRRGRTPVGAASPSAHAKCPPGRSPDGHSAHSGCVFPCGARLPRVSDLRRIRPRRKTTRSRSDRHRRSGGPRRRGDRRRGDRPTTNRRRLRRPTSCRRPRPRCRRSCATTAARSSRSGGRPS